MKRIVVLAALISAPAHAGTVCAILDMTKTPPIVTNRVEYDADISGSTPPGMAATAQAQCGGTFDIRWKWQNGALVNPDPQPQAAPIVPQQVSAMQAKVALSRAGLLSAVQTWINGQSAETQLIWNSAPSFDRQSGLINSAAAALGLSQSQIDQLFITAATVNP